VPYTDPPRAGCKLAQPPIAQVPKVLFTTLPGFAGLSPLPFPRKYNINIPTHHPILSLSPIHYCRIFTITTVFLTNRRPNPLTSYS